MAGGRLASRRSRADRGGAGADPRVRSADGPASGLRRLLAGGTAGNERLTTITGVLLVLMLAALGVTIVRIGSLLAPHLFIGMLLIPPVLLKMASTGYRFARYYTASPAYRLKGPPLAPLRAIAPLVVVSTVVVFASGVVLLFAGPASRGALLPLHKVSFIVWIAFTAVHVLAHIPATVRALRRDWSTHAQLRGAHAGSLPAVPGRPARMLSLAGALAAGAVLAIAVIPQFGPWLLHPHG
jgi:hypothetical protein